MAHRERASASTSTARPPPLDYTRRRLSTIDFPSPPPSPTYYPSASPQPPTLPHRTQRVLALLLKPLVLPALAVALPLWPLLLLACAVPVVGVMAIPILLLVSVLLLYAIAWMCYLFLAQKDLPATWASAVAWSPRRWLPFVPLNPVRCAKVDVAAFRYVVTLIRVVFPAVFDWSYRRIMVIGTSKGSRVVKEGILYGSPTRGKRLDVYLPADPSPSSSSSTPPNTGAPTIVVIPSMLAPLTLSSKRRVYLQLALRLRRMGYCVVVADITYYPESRVRASVVDLRLVLRWTARNCQRYGGDSSKIYLMGHGLSAHLAMLTIAQEAVVLSREGFLNRAYERERCVRRVAEGGEEEEDGEEWMKSGEVRTSAGEARRKRVGSGADALDEENHEPVPLAGGGRGARPSSSGGPSTSAEGWVDDDASHQAVPGHVMGTSRFASKSTSSDPILSSASYQRALDEVGNGLRRVEIYEPSIRLPALAGVILLSGISDVIKGFRSESERGLEHLSYLRRATGPSHFNCLIHSPAHLLYAAKNIVDTRLLPPKFLLVHGGKDRVVPVEQSTLLKTLLVGIGVSEVRLRAYRNLGHAEAVACLFLGMGRGMSRYTRQISEDVAAFVGQ